MRVRVRVRVCVCGRVCAKVRVGGYACLCHWHCRSLSKSIGKVDAKEREREKRERKRRERRDSARESKDGVHFDDSSMTHDVKHCVNPSQLQHLDNHPHESSMTHHESSMTHDNHPYPYSVQQRRAGG